MLGRNVQNVFYCMECVQSQSGPIPLSGPPDGNLEGQRIFCGIGKGCNGGCIVFM